MSGKLPHHAVQEFVSGYVSALRLVCQDDEREMFSMTMAMLGSVALLFPEPARFMETARTFCDTTMDVYRGQQERLS